MDETGRNEIFLAHCANVREIEGSWVQLRRAINAALRQNDASAVRALSKVAAITFCAFSESTLLKLLHTPFGLTLDEIQQVQLTRRQKSVTEAWKKCIHLALAYVEGTNSGFVPNTKQKFDRLVEDYVLAPSLLRNKIAHGQWKVAINRAGTSMNEELTNDLGQLDYMVIERWYVALTRIVEIVEWMIESPRKAFPANFWIVIDKLQQDLDRRENWTLDSKRAQLQRKPRLKRP